MLVTSPTLAHDLSGPVEDALRILARDGEATPAAVLFKAKQLVAQLEALELAPPDGTSPADHISSTLISAIQELPAGQRQAAQALFGLDPEASSMRVGERRARAGAALGVSPGTFRNHQEARLLSALAERVAFAIASPARTTQPAADLKIATPSSVLVLAANGSMGAVVITEHLRSLGLSPLTLNETLERSGYAAPSLIDNLKLSLSLSQAVVVVLESQPANDTANLALSAGMSLGLAPEKTILIQLGDARLPVAIDGLNVLRLRNASESRAALAAALARTGCWISDKSDRSGAAPEQVADLTAGWYRWTPIDAEIAADSKIADAVAAFECLENEAGEAASRWLRDDALASHPATVTSLLIGPGQVLGFVAMGAGTIRLTKRDLRSFMPSSRAGTDHGVAVIQCVGRHRNTSPGTGRLLVEFAIGEALQAAEHTGVVALVIEPPNRASARFFTDRWHFQPFERSATSLWLPLSSP